MKFINYIKSLPIEGWIAIGLILSMIYLICACLYHFWIAHPNRALLELNVFVSISALVTFSNRRLYK
jgi:hypothetical protein